MTDRPAYDYHPLANLLPMMSEDEFASFKLDIAENGQVDKGHTYDGLLLDGRNRERACRELGINFLCEPFDGTYEQAFAFVCSKNHHRHLSESQKACVAANFLDVFEKERSEGKFAGISGKSRDHASLLFGVSERYVSEARRLRNEAPEAFADVFTGSIKLTAAIARSRHVSRAKAVRHLREATVATPENCQLLHGNNDDVMFDHVPDSSVRVVFADPPYNNGWRYRDDPEGDRLSELSYLRVLSDTFSQCKRVLTDDGSIFVLIDDRWSDEIGLMLRDLGFFQRRIIVWHETFGVYQSAETNISSECRFIHYYAKTDAPFFNTVELREPSKRLSEYGDKRANPNGKIPGNVWQIPRITGNHSERVPWQDDGQAPQVPIELPQRCILLASEPGDTVLDPYNGNGITGIAALRNGRKYIGIDRDALGLRRAEQWINQSLANQETK